MRKSAKNGNNMVLAKMLKIHEVQRLQLRLIEIASFNNMEGVKIVRDLLNNKDLWECCLMDREAYNYGESQSLAGRINLIKLRDMTEESYQRVGECWNVDTLYILPKNGKESKLEEMIEECHWQGDREWIEKLESNETLGGYPSQKSVRLMKIYWD